jgi:hypothetical protein
VTIKHRKTHTPEWRAWRNMRARCTNPNHQAWKNYGGRGIVVCPEWSAADGFAAFYAHVGARPATGYELDRIDNSRGYEPGNVRWATCAENAKNKRTAHLIEVDGVSRNMSDWARLAGFSVQVIAHRLRAGWSPRDAVTKPVGSGHRWNRDAA